MEYTINIKGRLMDLSTPQVMGILNVTPDSFYSGSRKQTEMEIAQRANQIIEEGGSIIDVGAFSTRPGADEVSEEEEGRRLKFALDIVRREQPDAAVSVDTYRPTLARKCIEEWGADDHQRCIRRWNHRHRQCAAGAETGGISRNVLGGGRTEGTLYINVGAAYARNDDEGLCKRSAAVA